MSFIEKVKENKAFALVLAGVAAAGTYFYFKRNCAQSQKKCPFSGKTDKASAKTLYEKLGGKANIETAVVKFYEKVLKDERVKHFFKNTDM